MKELKEYFSGRGQVKEYVFNQISQTKHVYLYEVRGKDTIHYEVFKRVENTMYDCVSYPSDKAFGVWAWTCLTLERAKEKFNELNEVQELKNIS
tara:strand:+ start:626 stop:907 length:282 start_codon:yes stop_codon:yes gene_type:complete